jgi:hypothetical protein
MLRGVAFAAAVLAIFLAAPAAEAAQPDPPAQSRGVHKAKPHRPAVGTKGRVRLAPREPSYLYQPPRAVSRTPSVEIEAPPMPNRNPCVSGQPALNGACASPLGKPTSPFYGVGPYPGPSFDSNMPGSWRPPVPSGPMIAAPPMPKPLAPIR